MTSFLSDRLRRRGAYVVLFLVGLALCAHGWSTPAVAKKFDGVTLRCVFIGGGQYEKMYEQIPEFEEQTGANVRIVFKGNGFEVDKRLKQDFASGVADYDVVWDHTTFYHQYIPYLEPLNKHFSHEYLSDFLPRILDGSTRDGNLWLIPRHADISALHYRTDVFNDSENKRKFRQEHGYELAPPETWQEFRDIALFLADPPRLYGTQFAGKEEALTGRFYEILIAKGGHFLDEEGRPAFNSPVGVEAVSLLRDLYQADAMPKDMVNYLWDDVAKVWANGNVAMYTEWYGWYSFFQNPENSKVVGKFDLARQPRGENTDIHSGWAGAHGFSVVKDSDNKEAAVALIKFLSRFESQYAEAKLGFLPVRQSVWDQVIEDASDAERDLDQKRLKLARKQLENDFLPPPPTADWIPMSNVLYPKIQEIMLGDVGPEKGLDQAADKINESVLD